MNLLAQLKERYTTSHTPFHGHGDISRTSSATNTSRGSATQPPQPQQDVSPRAQSSFLLSTASGTTPQASRRLLAGEPSPEWSPGTGGSSRFTRGVASWSKAIAEVRAQAAAEVQAIQQRAAIEKYSVNSTTAAPTLHAFLTLTLALTLLNPRASLVRRMKWEAETSTQEAIAALRQVHWQLNSFAPTTPVSSLCPLHLLQQHTKELQAAHKAGASTTSSHGEALAQRQVEALQQQVNHRMHHVCQRKR